MKNKLKQFKEKYSHIILLVFTIIMFLVSMLASFYLGLDKGKQINNTTTEERFVKRANTSNEIYTSLFINLKLGGISNLSSSYYEFGNYNFSLDESLYKYFYIQNSLFVGEYPNQHYEYYIYNFNEIENFSLDNLFMYDIYTSFNTVKYTDTSVGLNNCIVYFDVLQYCLDTNQKRCKTPLKINFDSIYNKSTSSKNVYSHIITFGTSASSQNDPLSLKLLSTSLFNSSNSYTGTEFDYNTNSTNIPATSYIYNYSFSFSYYSIYLMKKNVNELVSSEYLESIYQQAFEDGYSQGLETSTQNSYNEGFMNGVNSSLNPLIGFDNTYINMLYQGDTDWIVDDANINLPINGYTYDFNNYVSSLKSTREDEGNGNDNGVSYIDLYDFTPFIDNQLEFYLVGFYKLEYVYNDMSLGMVNISNYREYSTITLNNNKLVESIKLYFYANEDIQNGYILNLYTTNTYQDGYQNGYNQGFTQGNQNGFKDGYIEGKEEGRTEGYDIGKIEGYNQGYNVGNSETCKLNTLVFSIADIPVYILSKLLGFEIFGFNVFVSLCSIITIILIIFLVKKFSK